MQPPTQITPASLSDYFNVMTRAVFQAGINWNVVANKWPGTTEALAEFNPHIIAEYTPLVIDRLMTDARLIRNRKKLEAIVHNAHTMLALDQEFGGFENYLSSKGDFDAISKDLRKRFKFLGDLGAYYFLYVVGEPVPPHDEWQASRNN